MRIGVGLFPRLGEVYEFPADLVDFSRLCRLSLLLGGCNMVLMTPSGDIALQQRNLILASVALMLLIIVPVIALTLLLRLALPPVQHGGHLRAGLGPLDRSSSW